MTVPRKRYRISSQPIDENHPLWGKFKTDLPPPDYDHFVCIDCDAAVYRPRRPFDADSRCLNCVYGWKRKKRK
jgi:hypothetical protein